MQAAGYPRNTQISTEASISRNPYRTRAPAVVQPLLYLYAGTVICGTTLENDVLASLSGLLRKAFRLLLIGFASVFTLYLSLTGILTGSADGPTPPP